MNRNALCLLVATLAVVAGAPMVLGSSITLISDTQMAPPLGYNGEPGLPGDPYDISAEGNLDWVVSCINEKAGASVIATGGTAANGPSGLGVFASVGHADVWDGPNFSWTGWYE